MQTLMWTLQSLLIYVFEQPVKIRMRSPFFPFSEPSMEVDVFYKNQWIEILGARMINEKVLELAGYKKTIIEEQLQLELVLNGQQWLNSNLWLGVKNIF